MESTTAADRTPSSSTGLRVALAALGLALLVAAVRYLPVRSQLTAFLDWVQGVGVPGMALFVALYVVATLAFVPGSLLTLGAGYAFGVVWGTILVSIGSTIGAALSFLVGRFLARDWVREKIAERPRFRAIDSALEKQSFKVVFLLRLVPLLPFNALNYGFGVSKVSFRRYFLASWIGMLPATLMYVYFGSLAEKVTRLAAGTPGDRVPVWAVGETVRRLSAGELQTGALENLAYWLGFVAVLAVSWLLTRNAKSELDRITQSSRTDRDESVEGRVEEAKAAHDSPPELEPDDAHNRDLRGRVHPANWTTPTPDERYDFVAIGGGTAGLVGSAGAATLGANAALVERAWLGGDCLVSGCVPSKALIRSARAAAELDRSEALGIDVTGEVAVDFERVMERVRSVRAEIAEEDAAERFSDLGVDIHFGHASFVDEQTLEVKDRRFAFDRALIATGAAPMVPPIEGIEEAGYLTNETVFSLTELPERLAVVGGGPVGCELAQAFQRFGSQVTIVEMSERLLSGDDADASAVVGRALRDDGVELHLETRVVGATRSDGAKRLHLEGVDGSTDSIEIDEILLAAGRVPNLDGLALERAGVDYDEETGVLVDDGLQTSNSRIYAAGDVASRHKFTHVADAQARAALRNALFPGRQRHSDLVIPWVTYTEPEVAHVGLFPDQARERGLEVETFEKELSEVHRAVVDRATDGFLKIHVESGTDTILGATLVADHAGESITELTLAMKREIGLGALAETIHPYPTTSAVIRRVADDYNRTRLKPWIKSLIGYWLRWF